MVDSHKMGDSTQPAGPCESLETLVDEWESASRSLPAKGEVAGTSLYLLLLLRDRIAASIRNGELPSLPLAGRIARIDGKLSSARERLAEGEVQTFYDLRRSIQPPHGHWWWFHDKPSGPWWTIGAVALLTFAVTLITDFTRRILAADPGGIGIVPIAVQALLAVGATSTFAEGGRQWLEGILSRCKVPRRHLPALKLALMMALFLIVLLGWETVPRLLARYYNSLGENAKSGRTDSSGSDPWSQHALGYFQRAAALDPEYIPASFNLGSAYEDSFQYEKAIAAYQQTLVLDPVDVAAYSNLTRSYIIANQPLNALRAAQNGVAVVKRYPLNNPTDDELQTIAKLHKNLAWAEFQLGFYNSAEADIALAVRHKGVAAAAFCVLGRIYTQRNEPVRAREAWENFRSAVASMKSTAMIEPDCILLEETSLNERK